MKVSDKKKSIAKKLRPGWLPKINSDGSIKHTGKSKFRPHHDDPASEVYRDNFNHNR